MTNGEKFRTAEERTIAFGKYCSQGGGCNKCRLKKGPGGDMCRFAWLDLEYEEELANCPFCGGEARTVYAGSGVTFYFVECKKCLGKTASNFKKDEAIAAWNRRV